MKILLTADLHYDKRNKEGVSSFIKEINNTDADVLILAGDISSGTAYTVECLKQFRDFTNGKYIVAGNHDLWVENGDSFEIYSSRFPKLAAMGEFHSLDEKPAIVENLGLVGTVGWYDFSLRNKKLKIPMKLYKGKSLPGIATWNDKYFIKWNYTDIEFVDFTLQKLKNDIEGIYTDVKNIICVVHHLPFAGLLPEKKEEIFPFFYAYAGSKKFGKLLIQYNKIKYVFCGHTHRYKKIKIGHLHAINIGCRRSQRRFSVLEL